MAPFEKNEHNGIAQPLLADVVTGGTCAGADDLEEAPPGLKAYERLHSKLDRSGSHWIQTTSALLALQLGWGLWLFPADFARLGWYTGAGCLGALALLTGYSGFLFSRLYRATPGAVHARVIGMYLYRSPNHMVVYRSSRLMFHVLLPVVLFGDIGFRAAGSLGRNLVYTIIYSLDATRCVILHLAAASSLQHIFPEDHLPPLWQCGAAVLVGAGLLVQIQSLAKLTWMFTAGTTSQLVAIGIVLYELIQNPNPDAEHSTQAVSAETIVPSLVSLMNMIFAFGGQFAFVEIMSSMRRPSEFPKAITVCTATMTALYGAVGAAGYWSSGSAVTGIIIFDLGHSPRIRLAAACILVQATSQYLVNLNVWTHNLLVLMARNSGCSKSNSRNNPNTSNSHPEDSNSQNDDGAREPAFGSGDHAGQDGQQPALRCASDHARGRWLVASLFVVLYSYVISTSVPYFGSLVGVVTSATYLAAAYILPTWFTLNLLGSHLGVPERCFMCLLIPACLALSGVGLYSSVLSIMDEVASDTDGGWGASSGGSGLLELLHGLST